MLISEKKYKRNVKAVYAFTFSRMFLIVMPVLITYFISLGFSMQQVFELQVIFGLTVAILEIPSGYLSDMWGRKKVLLLGSFFVGLGFTSMYFADTYIRFVFVQILLGIAISMISGSDISILYDSLLKLGGQRKEKMKAVANNQMAMVGSEALAALLGGYLVLTSYKSVLTGQLIVGWIPLFVCLFLFDPPYRKMEKGRHKENFKKVIRHIFCDEKLLKLIFINMVIWSLATFVVVWVFQKYWQDIGIDLAYFGFLWAGYNILVGIIGKQVHWLEERVGAIPLLITLSILPVIGFFSLGYFGSIIGVIMGLSFQISRGITHVILKDALNWRVDSSFRSTANSIVSLTFRMGFTIIGPIVGYCIDRFGMTNSMYGVGFFFLLGFIFFMLPLLSEVKKIGVESIPEKK